MNRRSFIYKSTAIATTGMVYPIPNLWAKKEYEKITILHTNDVHSRIEPFPTGSRLAGKGGYAKRAAIIKHIREREKNVILLDAGDLIQGTPYFNLFNGELEIKLMNAMQYDVTTIGNHDFDAGMDGLKNMVDLANFSFVSSNYNFDDTEVAGQILKHKIIEKENIKIGIFGLGIQLDGLVPELKYKNTTYLKPFYIAEQTASFLKKEANCDLVICLSHLGYQYKDKTPSDKQLAQATNNIDLIIGGHTHTLFNQPEVLKNVDGARVLVNQVGWGGTHVGRVDFYFEKKSRKFKVEPHIVIST